MGRSWAALKRFLVASGTLLGVACASLKALGSILNNLGPSGLDLGSILEDFGEHLGRIWEGFGRILAFLGVDFGEIWDKSLHRKMQFSTLHLPNPLQKKSYSGDPRAASRSPAERHNARGSPPSSVLDPVDQSTPCLGGGAKLLSGGLRVSRRVR